MSEHSSDEQSQGSEGVEFRNAEFMARTKSFTRRSRDLKPALERAFAKHRDKYVIEVPRDVGLTTAHPDFRLSPTEVFGREAPLVVEVGSGRGEQMLTAAASNPERDYLAFEVWVPGLARLTAKAGEAGLTNIRVIEADAQLALKSILDEATVSELWTFFPDPWRKSRHHKRRLVSDDFAETVARVLEDGGLWRLATDWENYAGQMLGVLSRAEELENPYELESVALQDAVREAGHSIGQSTGIDRTQCAAQGTVQVPAPQTGGFSPRFDGRVFTHFEERGAKAGRPAWDLVAVRLPRTP
ncbi:tRNA (guanosine(46)-N7)-methyltransferase TrmB [Actinomycetaceae bacterium MB13-C1-2]|nr:tRNA (guanosine(46)-N7)-methyltransferase TrmB [Actinomycetaceae bacterium MB13-C1-2]